MKRDGNDIRVGVINIKNDDIKMSYKNNTSKVDLLLIPPIKVLKGDELNKGDDIHVGVNFKFI